MEENLFKNNQEKFVPKVELATPEDAEDCKRLRLMQISGEDSKMFGVITEEILKYEKDKTKEDWQKDISGDKIFFALSKNGSHSVGLGRAIEEGEGIWRMGWAYTEKDFRGKGFGRKNSILRLKELLNRNAKQVKVYVLKDNETSINLQKSLGFKIIEEYPDDNVYLLSMDLTNPDVIKKINDFVV